MAIFEVKLKDGKFQCFKESDNYNLVKMKDGVFHTLEEAEKYINSNYVSKYTYDKPWINHEIQGYRGHLMTLIEWKVWCDEGSFIDYDGYGDLLNENFEFLNRTIFPSQYTENKVEIPHDVKFILWYNR